MSYVVLGLIARLGEATSYELKAFADATVNHFWPSPHATLYAEPTRLAGAGLLDVSQEQSGRRRRRYSLTPDGRRVLDAWLEESRGSPPVMRDEAAVRLFFGASPEAVVPGRRVWHVEQVKALRDRLRALEASGGDESTERVLRYAIAVNAKLAEAFDLVAVDDPDAVDELADRILS